MNYKKLLEKNREDKYGFKIPNKTEIQLPYTEALTNFKITTNRLSPNLLLHRCILVGNASETV